MTGTDEVRVTSGSGAAKGDKLARFDLIPSSALWLLAEAYGKGRAKYEAVGGLDNWRNGYEFSLAFAAIHRHLNAFWSGENVDPETGNLHIIAAIFHLMTLTTWLQDPAMIARFDDRQDPVRPTWIEELQAVSSDTTRIWEYAPTYI